MPNLVLFSVLWLDCSLFSNGEVWREMASDGKKGRKDEEGREREGEGNLAARPRAWLRGEGERPTDTTTDFPALSPNTELQNL